MLHGVSFFFVLSGFILTHVYTSKPMLSYGSFLRARFARLWPVHLAATLLLFLTVPAISLTYDGPGIFDKWIVLGFNLSLLHSAFPFLSYIFSWNAVSWSISTEFFFYAAFPFLLRNLETTWHWKVLGSAALCILFIAGLAAAGIQLSSPDVNKLTAVAATYGSPITRIFEFSLGMACWAIWHKHIRNWSFSALVWTILELASLALCAVAILVIYPGIMKSLSRWVLLYGHPAGSFWVFPFVVMAFATGRGAISRLLSTRALVFLGEISFSIYMLHQVMIKIFSVTLDWPDVPEIVFFPLVLAFAATSYLLVERPGQRLLLGVGQRCRAAAIKKAA